VGRVGAVRCNKDPTLRFSQGVHKIVSETKTTLNHENKNSCKSFIAQSDLVDRAAKIPRGFGVRVGQKYQQRCKTTQQVTEL
jgi:hypothetical protein